MTVAADTEFAAQLRALVDDQGARWRARTNDGDASSYAAGVLHGLCIAFAVATGDDSDAVLHEQMSGRPRVERQVGEIRTVKIGVTSWERDRYAVERWDGVSWSRVPLKAEDSAA